MMKIKFLASTLFILISFISVMAQPLQNRILIASSLDGLNWQRLNMVLIDSGDVPDAVIGPNSHVYAYFQGLWTHYIDGIMVGISSDGINNWEFHQIPIPGTETWPGRPCDPDIIFRNDTFRLYFTGDPINDTRPETYSAISLDGINFTKENGVRFEVAGSPVLDPSLLWTGDTLQYFAGGAPQGENWHSHSVDGLLFSRQSNFMADSGMMANGIQLPQQGYRFYTFSNNPNNTGIRSIFSLDGREWTADSGYRLQLDTTNGLESRYVKDPAIVFKDSIYFMYYVTRKPPAAIAEGYIDKINDNMRISPNPSKGVFKIEMRYSIKFGSLSTIQIYDVLGKMIKLLELNTHATTINLSDIPDGVYFVSFGLTSNDDIKRIIILK